MLRSIEILVSAPARRLALAACVVGVLAACGQKGPLFLPAGEAAQGRATLGQTLSPQVSPAPLPNAPASAPPATGTASPVRVP